MRNIEVFWTELGRREKLLRDSYTRLNIALPPSQGMARALDEAKDLAEGIKTVSSDTALVETIQACHTVYAIAESVEVCLGFGLDVSRQLSAMATGTINYGTPGNTSAKSIYLKDFEYELFIAASLIRAGLRPKLLDNPSDPMGEMEVEGIVVECKHPDSTGGLPDKLKKFARKLRKSGRFGFFAVAVEDAHHLGDQIVFGSKLYYDSWLDSKQAEMEESGQKLAGFAAYRDVVLGLIHTQTKVVVIAGATGMKRHSTSLLFDRPSTPEAMTRGAEKIARVFNPSPHHFARPVTASSREDIVPNGQPPSEPVAGD